MDRIRSNQNQKILKNFFIIILGSLILTISAKIKIPFYPVPMTMQTFVVLFLGITFGYKIGLSIITVYLLEGILGLPVFSNSPEKGVGLVYFTGPTMGYLIGFLSAVFLTGYFNFGKNIIQNSLFHLLLISKHIFLFPEILKKGFERYLFVNLIISNGETSSIFEFKSFSEMGFMP